MNAASRSSFRERRSAARLAAVQALYAMEVAGAGGMERIIDDLARRRWSADGEPAAEAVPEALPDEGWLRLVVDGVVLHRPRLDPEIDAALSQGWTLARLELLLQAILRAGAYELAERREVPIKVVITEYLEIAHAFYAGKEPSLINAVLDRLAPRLRPQPGDAADRNGDRPEGDTEDGGRWTNSS